MLFRSVLYIKESEMQSVYQPNQRVMMANSNWSDDTGTANEGLNFKKIKYYYEIEAHFAIQ